MSSDAQSFGQLLNKNSSLFYVICNREVVARAGADLSNNDIPVTSPLDKGSKGAQFYQICYSLINMRQLQILFN